MAALSAPDLVAPAPPVATAVTLRVLRPRVISRLLLVSAMGLLAGTTLLAAVLVWTLAELRLAVRLAEAALQPSLLQAPLPSPERLCDDRAVAVWLERHPDDSLRLHVARAQALIAAGRREDAVAAYTLAAQRGRLGPLQRVVWAEILCDLGDPVAAARVLDGVDLSPLPPDQLPRALAITGQAHLLNRQRSAATTAP